MIRALLTLLVLLTTIHSVRSQVDGETHNGYVYEGKYWWKNGQPYTRERIVYTENTYSCGYCYPQQYYYYKYTPYTVTPVDYAWRSKLLDIAAARDRVEGRLRLAANEHNQFLEAVKALGLQGNFAWSNYGIAPQLAQGYRYDNIASAHLGNYGANGNSIYGYTYSSVADVYGATDPNLLYQQAAALAKNSQDLGGQATANFSTLVEQAGNNRARVAEILAKGQSAAAALSASNAAASASVKTTVTGTGAAVTPTPTPAPAPTPVSPQGSIGYQKCGACHGQQSYTAKGGEFQMFDVEGKYLALKPQQLARIKRRVGSGQMPPAPNPPLLEPELTAFYDELQRINQGSPTVPASPAIK